MTVGTTVTTQPATGDGVTTVFSFPFFIFSADEMVVYKNGGVVAGYTVSINDGNVGGTVNFLTPPAMNDLLLFARVCPLVQGTDLKEQRTLPAQTLENTFDYLMLCIQQLQEQLNRALLYAITSPPGISVSIPPLQALDVLRANAAGNGLEFVTPMQANLDADPNGPLPSPGNNTDLLAWGSNGKLGNVTIQDVADEVGPLVTLGDVTGPSGGTTQYGVALFDSTTGKALRVNPSLGSNGQIFTSNGPGAAPSFKTGTTLVTPSALPKNKRITQNTYNTISLKMSNGQILQAGAQGYGPARGGATGWVGFGGVMFDPTHTPPAGSVVLDWFDAAGSIFVLMQPPAGNNIVYSAGQNQGGQLGQGNTTTLNVLTRIQYFVTNNINITAIYGTAGGADQGFASVFFVSDANKVYGCGLNTTGQLGNGGTTNLTTPAQVLDGGVNTIVDIKSQETTSGYGNTAILTSDGTIHVTGKNTFGQLGQGNTTDLHSFTSVTLPNTTAIALAVTTNAVCMAAITSDSGGSLYVWGYNGMYQGANGGTANKTSPGSALLTGISQVLFYGSNTGLSVAALASNGDLYTWGGNGLNNTFNNSTTTVQTPTKVFSTTASKMWGWFSNVGSTYGNLYVLDTSGIMRFAGNNINSSANIFPLVADTAFKATGAYRCVLPAEVDNGDDSISDILIIANTASAAAKGLILTTNGSLYGGGYAGDYMLTGFHALVPTQPSNVYNNRLNKYLWGN